MDGGEIILMKFRPQINEIVLNSLSEMLSYSGNKNIAVMFKPKLLNVDLVGKSKVLKMKTFNGFYGCTLCTQREVFIMVEPIDTHMMKSLS